MGFYSIEQRFRILKLDERDSLEALPCWYPIFCSSVLSVRAPVARASCGYTCVP